jgi:hypothetical protein
MPAQSSGEEFSDGGLAGSADPGQDDDEQLIQSTD